MKNRGASKHTLTCTWAALCRALVWEAKHNRQYFPGDCTERSLAFIEYCEHYEQIARDIMPGIKQFKKIMARDRHRQEAAGEGRKNTNAAKICEAVIKWNDSKEKGKSSNGGCDVQFWQAK